MIDKAQAIKNLAPEAEWVMRDGVIEWLSADIPQPTDEEIEAEVERLIAEQPAKEARAQRNRLLVESDWTQVLDAPVNHETWAEYRQALRDLPQQAGFPTEITWPVKPE